MAKGVPTMRKAIAFLLLGALLLALCACGKKEITEEEPLRIAVVSDIHNTGVESYLYTGSFRAANDASGTGKQVELLPSLMDAFVAQTLREKPDCLLITGDLSFNGARVSHEALIAKLETLREAGVVVLVLPGNHDIDGSALIFPDGETQYAESISAEEFASLYAAYGYDGAASRDPASLSYVYDTGRGVRFFMLDTCFYYGTVYGRLGEETMTWLEKELAACREAGEIPIVAGHHNALVHHSLFAFNYTMDDGEELRELLMKYGVTLYLSGHLHPQSIVWEEGFCDIATESFAVYPHRFGMLELRGGSWRYTAGETDVERWAADSGSTDERLLHYDTWGRSFFYDQARAQAEGGLAAAVEDEALRRALCDHFAEANVGYFTGVPAAPAEGELAEEIAKLSGRSAYYLQTITGLPDSLSAEGVIG